MNSIFKRVSALILVLMLVVSALPASVFAAGTITTTPTGYTKASDVVYKTGSKGWIINWGARGETCVFLSPNAQNFYTGTNTFDSLSKLSGGSSQSNAPQSALYSALSKLMKDNHHTTNTYDASKQMFAYTDCVSNDNSKLSSFYSGTMVNSAWSSGGTVWNREHVWPNSKGMNGRDEDDIMMLRPTVPSENGSRGNTAFGESSSYFEPGASNRGDVARVALYVYVRWGNTSRMWGTGGVIENLNILLKWMEEDPVDTWEMGRNDAVESITGTRNVFVDYPEFAWLLFGQDVPEGITTPSDNDGVVANPGGGSSSGGSSSGGSSSGGSSSGGSTSGSNTDKSYTQLSSLKDGDQVLIVNPAHNMALSTTKTGFYNVGIDISSGFSGVSDSDIYTAKKNSDGSWSFTAPGGKKLALADQYNSINESGSHDKWELTSAGDKLFYLRNSSRDVYLDWYADKNNWSTYKPDSLDDCYALAFYVKSSAGGDIDDDPGATTPDDIPDATEPDATEPNTTEPVVTEPVVTEPVVTDPVATEPTQSVQPTESQQSTPSQPAPLPTNPVPTVPTTATQDSLDITTLIIIIAAVVVVIGGASTAVIVIKRKKIK